ncbi:hypothetical protein [Neobacillus sp. 19]|uniref:hypothetical protein n=1 Tax=Neobacillus sp. 19 TaxID=3394458 RepID=UPI003BF6381C
MKISPCTKWLVNTELFMTIGVIIIGTLLYIYLRKWYRVYRFYQKKAQMLNNLYNFSLERMENISGSLTNKYMTGFIRDYFFRYIFAFIIVVVGGAMCHSMHFLFDPSNDAPVNLFETGLVVAIIAALTVLVSKKQADRHRCCWGTGLSCFFFSSISSA